jgi:hypothetical protein
MSKWAWAGVLRTSEANPTPTAVAAPVKFKAPYPIQPDTGFCGKLFVRQSGLFSPDHDQIAAGFNFERKRLVMEENPCFFVVSDVNSALCKCQMRGWGQKS